MSSQGPTHSLASMAPDLSAVIISAPGTATTVEPILRRTSAPSPGIRYFRSRKSAGLFTSLTNQPPICTPVLQTTKDFIVERSHGLVPQSLSTAKHQPGAHFVGGHAVRGRTDDVQ